MNIDPRSVSLRLAGQLAYSESVLKTGRSPDDAIRLLDWARLLAPGSLVEEAALRREILLAGDQRQGDRVILLARQYVSRFPRSIYADIFILGLSAASVRYRLLDDILNLRKFETLLMPATANQRRDFLLKISRVQTINGKYEVAGAAARAVLSEMPADAPETRRAPGSIKRPPSWWATITTPALLRCTRSIGRSSMAPISPYSPPPCKSPCACARRPRTRRSKRPTTRTRSLRRARPILSTSATPIRSARRSGAPNRLSARGDELISSEGRLDERNRRQILDDFVARRPAARPRRGGERGNKLLRDRVRFDL